MAPSSPTVSLLEFRLRIRKRRVELGIAAEDVRKHLKVSRVYYSSIENGRAILSDAKLEPLLSILELRDQAEELGTLLSESRTRGWWQDYAGALEPAFSEFIGLEHGASHVRILENRLMTGLIQTRTYAEQVMRASPDVSLKHLEPTLDVRMRRQLRLDHPDPLQVDLVLSETVLMQQFGGPSVLLAQLQTLLARIENTHSAVTMRVQPFHLTPLGGTVASTIVLFDFESAHLPTIAWRETSGAVEVVYDPTEVQAEALHFSQAKLSTLGPQDSMELVRQRIDALRKVA